MVGHATSYIGCSTPYIGYATSYIGYANPYIPTVPYRPSYIRWHIAPHTSLYLIAPHTSLFLRRHITPHTFLCHITPHTCLSHLIHSYASSVPANFNHPYEYEGNQRRRQPNARVPRVLTRSFSHTHLRVPRVTTRFRTLVTHSEL